MDLRAGLDYSQPIPFDFPTSFDRDLPAILVGCGAVAINYHFPRIQSLVRRPKIYLMEVDASRSEYLRNRWKSNPRVEVIDELPVETEFSLAVISTPPKYHYDYFNLLRSAAEFVLIEKPMVANVAQAESIISEPGSAKVFVNLIRRLLLNYRLVCGLYRSQFFGRLRRVELREGGVFNWPAVSLGSFSKELNGGGVLMDTGPHAVDLLFMVFDQLDLESSRMDAWGERTAIEANCELDLVADGCIPVSVALSRNRNLSNQVRFVFEDATCVLSVRDNRMDVFTSNGNNYSVIPPRNRDQAPIGYPEFFDMFYEQFIVPGNNTDVCPEESLKSIRVIERAYQQAERMKMGF